MKLRCLGDFVELRQGLAINKGSAHLVSDTQDITYCYPLLRIADMMDSNFSKFVSKDVNSSVIANPQDIIYTRTGQIGLAFRGMQGVVHNNSFIVSLKTDELEKDYLYTVLNSNFVKKQANSQAKNSVQPDLTHTMFKSIVIPVPDSREEQNRISKIINNINQKIQTNIQINQELEAMAKTLYDYWFVQFDFPDQNGKPYKSSDGKMVYHPELKREIPEGWGVEKLKYFSKYVSDKVESSELNIENYVGTDNMIVDMGGIELTTSIPKSGTSTKYSIGDILISNIRPYFKKIWLSDRVGGCSSDVLCIRTKKIVSREFVFATLARDDFFNYDVAGSKGSKMPRGDKKHIMEYPIVFDFEIADQFSKIVRPIYEAVHKNYIQNQELIQLRDWLLPMLMNGQVKVE